MVDAVAGEAVAGVDPDRRALDDEAFNGDVVGTERERDREAVAAGIDDRLPGRVEIPELRRRRLEAVECLDRLGVALDRQRLIDDDALAVAGRGRRGSDRLACAASTAAWIEVKSALAHCARSRSTTHVVRGRLRGRGGRDGHAGRHDGQQQSSGNDTNSAHRCSPPHGLYLIVSCATGETGWRRRRGTARRRSWCPAPELSVHCRVGV